MNAKGCSDRFWSGGNQFPHPSPILGDPLGEAIRERKKLLKKEKWYKEREQNDDNQQKQNTTKHHKTQKT